MPAPLNDVLARPLQDLRISVFDRCNFRCTYCMPAESLAGNGGFLRRREMLSDVEIERLVKAFVSLGAGKIRLTGGEPLLRPGLLYLIERLAGIPGVQDLALITNGILLPQMAQNLADAGLGRITVSLDSLDEEVFTEMSGGRGTPARVLEGIDAAEKAGFTRLKINTVAQRGINDHTVMDLLRHFRGTSHIYGSSNSWMLATATTGTRIALYRVRSG